MAALPAFTSPPPPPPGPANPDPAPDLGLGPGGGAGPGSPARAGSSIPVSAFKLRAQAFGKIAGTALQAGGGLINRGLAAGEEDLCFIPDKEDVDTIAPPVGRLAARRVQVPVGEENVSDVEDLMAAGIGLFAYAVKGVADWVTARSRRRAAVTGAAVIYPEDGTGSPPATSPAGELPPPSPWEAATAANTGAPVRGLHRAP